MADAKDSGSNLPTSGIVLLLVMATGTVFFARDLPLQGSRPPSAEHQIHETGAANGVEARLWQDPLAAVRKSWAEEKNGEEKKRRQLAGSTAFGCNASHRLQCRSLVGPRDRVIAVTVPGAPYAEDAESRRRDRYAILAALHEQKYVPEDGEHIDYFVPMDESEVVLPETIPFERLKPAEQDSKRPNIMILWIDEDALTRGPRPLASLASLYWQLKFLAGPQPTPAVADSDAAGMAGSTQSPEVPPAPRGFTIIGPNSSRTLKAMIEEVRGTPRWCADSKLSASCPIEFFDYGATASDEDAVPDGRGVEDYFREKGIVFHRMVTPDNVLARALARELQLRDICLTKNDCKRWLQSPGRVAIVSEWDTFYGRSLRATISRELCQPGSAPDCSLKFEQYSYLRGLDGQLPNDGSSVAVKSADTEKQNRAPANKKKDDDNSSDTAKRLERPDGLGQFDYLRRLAATMKRRHQELRRHGESGITAIGVLGTDVYDKLLVLRALRPEFPEALFFTTDLDARFSDQGEIAATRNLLVVSAFDLQLRPEIQRDIPPFRDGYQTAAFLFHARRDQQQRPGRLRKLHNAN
jgi:hypothetical protein